MTAGDEYFEPWERLPHESTAALAAFVAYRDMGARRSVRAVGQELHKSRSLIGRWSVRHGWVQRAAEWDAHVDREAAIDQLAAVKDMRRRHASLASVALARAAERLREMKPGELSPRDVVAFLREAVAVERVARGEPSTIAAVTGRDGGPVEVAVPDVTRAAALLAALAESGVLELDDDGSSEA